MQCARICFAGRYKSRTKLRPLPLYSALLPEEQAKVRKLRIVPLWYCMHLVLCFLSSAWRIGAGGLVRLRNLSRCAARSICPSRFRRFHGGKYFRNGSPDVHVDVVIVTLPRTRADLSFCMQY